MAHHFRFRPRDVDEMGWVDFLSFVDQVDEFARQAAKAQARQGLGDDG